MHLVPLALSLEGGHVKMLRDWMEDICLKLDRAALYGDALECDDVFNLLHKSRTTRPSRPCVAANNFEPISSQFSIAREAIAFGNKPSTDMKDLARSPAKVYFKDLFIADLNLHLSFAAGSWFKSNSETPATGSTRSIKGTAGDTPNAIHSSNRIGPETSRRTENGLAWWGVLFVSLVQGEEVWVRLPALHRQHPLLSYQTFVQLLTQHYVVAAFLELPKVGY